MPGYKLKAPGESEHGIFFIFHDLRWVCGSVPSFFARCSEDRRVRAKYTAEHSSSRSSVCGPKAASRSGYGSSLLGGEWGRGPESRMRMETASPGAGVTRCNFDLWVIVRMPTLCYSSTYPQSGDRVAYGQQENAHSHLQPPFRSDVGQKVPRDARSDPDVAGVCKAGRPHTDCKGMAVSSESCIVLPESTVADAPFSCSCFIASSRM